MGKLISCRGGKKTLASVLLMLGFTVGPVMTAQATLIGVSSSSPGKVYEISPLTGVATELVSTSATSFTGATFLGGDLFVSDVACTTGFCFETGTVDLGTGTYTFVSNQGGSNNWHGLASDESAGLIYTIDINDGYKLKSMTATGAITTIGTGTGIDGRGMAYDDTHNILYATGSAGTTGRDLYTIDTVLGTSSYIGATGRPGTEFYQGLAYDEVGGILYLTSGGASGVSSLYTLDITTGSATLVGSTGVVQLDGLAWTASVPEPATLALLSAGLAGLGLSRRKKSV